MKQIRKTNTMDLNPMWNSRNKTNIGKERQTKKQTLNYREQMDGSQKADGVGDGRNRGWALRHALVIMSAR